jgi:ribosomal protein S12 methylthiotransferase accessory factor
MKIKDCIKGYKQGISKVISPEQTCKVVLRKIQNVSPRILKGYFEVQRPSKIPQYRVIGTDYFQQIVQTEGTNGKGHFKEQALASGLMELVERYSCYKYRRNRNVFKISSFKDFKNNLFQLEDLYSNLTDKSCVKMLKDVLKTDKIRWSEGYSLNGRKVYLPIEIIVQIMEVSNGMAAGNSLEEALLHAICEVIERHCLTLIELNKLKTPLIDLSTINSSVTSELIKKFQSLNYPIFIKDFSLGIGLPVMGVVRKIDKSNCIITAGVATTREEALIRALVENSQCEGKPNNKKIYLAKHYFVNDKIISMKDILNVDNKNMRLELENIEEILNKQNMKVFFIDTTDKILSIPSVMVYIAGAKYFNEVIAYRIGSYYEQTERPDKAVEVYKKALKIWPNSGAIYLSLASAYFSLKHYEEAIKKTNRVIELNFIGGGSPHFVLGLCFEKIGQYKKAVKELKKAEQIYPEEPQINSSLSNCYRNIGQIEKANKELEKGVLKFKRRQQTAL